MNLKIFTEKNSEKARTKEAFMADSIVQEAINSDLHKAINCWKNYLNIVSNSEFKDMYQPEDAKENIKNKIYESVRNCNGKLKEKLDDLLFKEANGFRPLTECLDGFNLDVNEIYDHCRDGKAGELMDVINGEIFGSEVKIGNEVKKKIGMIESVETGKYDLGQLSRFDNSITNLEKLMKNFNVNDFSIKPKDNKMPIEKIAVQYSVNLIQIYVNNGRPSAIFTDNGMNTYAQIKEITEKYVERDMLKDESKDIRNYTVPRQLISQAQKKFDEKCEEFTKWAEKSQDRLYNLAVRKAKELNPMYKRCLDKFKEFSEIYSQILGEDNESLEIVRNKVESIKQEAYNKLSFEQQLAFCKGEK